MIAKLLDEIKEFYRRHGPVACSESHRLDEAIAEEITALEALTGERVPEDYREFLLKYDLRHSFDGNFECLDIQRVIGDWKMMTRLLKEGRFDDGRIEHHKRNDFGNWDGAFIQEVWWSAQWIPFARDSCGNFKCIDCAPGANGAKYQIIDMETQDGQGPFVSRYGSFAEYLQKHLQYFENGQYTVHDWGTEVDSHLKPGSLREVEIAGS